MLQGKPYKKKYLGQHFLHDKNIARKIACSLQLDGKAYQSLLEIGPGEGMLTSFIIDKEIDLFLVEIDSDLLPKLEVRFPSLQGKIINEDFLKLDINSLNISSFGVIGNFPYNISSQILFKILENRDKIPEMVGMFQKEVAERITAKEGSKTYGKLSVLLQAFYDIRLLFKVSNQVFSPPPKVESAVIRMQRKADYQLDCNEDLFMQLVKQAFSQRRKTLRNALSAFSNRLTNVPAHYLDKRAEMLDFNDYIIISKYIESA